MTISFLLLAAITIIGTAAAMSLKNLVHCVLALSLGLVGSQMEQELSDLQGVLVPLGHRLSPNNELREILPSRGSSGRAMDHLGRKEMD